MHLTDEQLNEYLDTESTDRVQIESHLSSCEECTARLTALKILFNELESLPEIPLSRSLVPRLTPQAPAFPGWLARTATLQAVFVLIALLTTAPLMMELISPYFSNVQVPSFAELFLELQSLWVGSLDIFSRIQVPTLPAVPIVELSSLVVVFTLIGVSILWLVGNGLLLRNQAK